MPYVLTTSSSVQCGHSGKVAVESLAKLQVNSSPILLKGSIEGKPITGCKTPSTSDTSGLTNQQCDQVSSVPPGPGVILGEATKLKVGGQPVMLDTLTGKTNGMVGKVTPQPLLSAMANQSKLMTI